MSSPSILLTGCTGLLGSHLLLRLCQSGQAVRALVRPGSRYREELERIFSWYVADTEQLLQPVEFIEGDVTDIPSLEPAFEGIKTVFHCAAIISVHRGDREALLQTNAEGTANMVNFALHVKVDWFCHVSSVATLGRNPEGLTDETFSWKHVPGVPDYPVSKYAAEQHVWRGVEEGLPAVIINPSFIVGPSVKATGSMSVFHLIARGWPFYTDGQSGFVDVRDVVEVMLRLHHERITGQRYIVSSENLSAKEFLKRVAGSLGRKAPHRQLPGWLLRLAGMGGSIMTALTGKRIPITPAAIRMSRSKNAYSNQKVRGQTGMLFRTVQEAAEHCGNIIKGGL